MLHRSGLAVTWPPPVPGAPITAAALELPLAAPPGTTVAYNNHGAQAVAEIVRRAVGRPVDEYAAEVLFGPLGFGDWVWNHSTDDRPYGMSSLLLCAADLVRVGQLAIARGAWNGRQLYASDWGDEERRPGCAFGLFEMLIPETDVHLDLADADELAADLQAALEPLAGTTLPLDGGRSLWSVLERTRGPARAAAAFAELRAAAPHLGFARPSPQAYGHDGSGGQHLWILPTADAVAVRMRDLDDRSYLAETATAFRTLALEALLGLAAPEAL
jgi:CubicO group peptidase (beta-lactamase class C family)